MKVTGDSSETLENDIVGAANRKGLPFLMAAGGTPIAPLNYAAVLLS